MGRDVIVACDFSSKEKVLSFLDQFTDRKPFVKIGMELYYAEGPDIVRELKKRGHKIFLDLKLHDIPNTVRKSMAVLSHLDVDITNLHAAGGTAMMQAALEGLTRRSTAFFGPDVFFAGILPCGRKGLPGNGLLGRIGCGHGLSPPIYFWLSVL